MLLSLDVVVCCWFSFLPLDSTYHIQPLYRLLAKIAVIIFRCKDKSEQRQGASFGMTPSIMSLKLITISSEIKFPLHFCVCPLDQTYVRAHTFCSKNRRK